MSVAGIWNCVVNTPIGKQTSVLHLSADGTTVTGTSVAKTSTDDLIDGKIDGSVVSFALQVKMPFPMTLKWVVTVDGDALHGTVDAGPFGTSKVSGTRVN